MLGSVIRIRRHAPCAAQNREPGPASSAALPAFGSLSSQRRTVVELAARAAAHPAEKADVQVTIHTDTLNESGFVEATIAAFKGRTIHTYHTEGAGGGPTAWHSAAASARYQTLSFPSPFYNQYSDQHQHNRGENNSRGERAIGIAGGDDDADHQREDGKKTHHDDHNSQED